MSNDGRKSHHDDVGKQVDDLRERMLLLQQDRRANIDKLESNKAANENEIRSLKEDNTKLRMRLSSLQKSAALDNDGNHRDADGLKKSVLQKRNDYDAQKSAAVKLGAKLNTLTDEARICLLEEQRPNQAEGPLSRQIRSLENRLDNAMIQYNEAHGICGTYEHIVKRLEEEKVSFDNQLTSLERTLESKHRDLEDLALLSSDASHAREIAQQNLQKAKLAFEDGKSRRSREIRERQQHVRIRKQMIKKHERSDEERRKTLGTADTDVSYSMVSPVPIGGRKSELQMSDQEHALNVYEAAFRKIKDATGVSNVDDVIRKLIGQESTTDNLNSLTAQNQSKMENLRGLQEFLAEEVEKLKHSCVPGSSKSPKTLDEQHELLYLRTSLSERTKSRLDCIAFLIMSVKAGVEHLRAKFTSLHGSEFVVGHGALAEDQLPDVIRSSGDLLVDVITKTEDSDLQMHFNTQDSKNTELVRSASHKNLQNRRPMSQGATEVRPFNQRITLPSAKEISAYDHDSDTEIAVGEFDAEEEISRDGVKKASSNIIAMEERRSLRMPEDG